MARGPINKEKLFKKGQSGNPKGRPAGTMSIPQELRAMNIKIVAEKIDFFLKKNVKELIELQKDKTLQAIDLMIIVIILKSMSGGDVYKFNFLLDRMIGKVPNKVDMTSDGKAVQGGSGVVIMIPSNGSESNNN